MKYPVRRGLATALCASALALTGFTPNAFAEDYKSFSSNVCVPNGPVSANDLSYSHQGMFNASQTESRVVICPLVKDAEDTWTSGDATLYVRYRSPGGSAGSVNCTAFIGSLSSGAVSVAASPPPIPANTSGTITLNLTTDPIWIWEPVNLVCALGPRMRLTRIYLRENTATHL